MNRMTGPKADEELTYVQHANDWISAEDSAGKTVILRPTSVRLDNDTYWRFRESFSAWQCGNTSTGQFWELWTQALDGTFEPTELAQQQGIARQPPGTPTD